MYGMTHPHAACICETPLNTLMVVLNAGYDSCHTRKQITCITWRIYMYGMTHLRDAFTCVTHMCDTAQHLDGCPECRIRRVLNTHTHDIYVITHVWHHSTPWWLSWTATACSLAEILKSQLAAKFTVHNDWRTDFWECLHCVLLRRDQRTADPWRYCFDMTHVIHTCHSGIHGWVMLHVWCQNFNGLPIRDVAVLTWLTSFVHVIRIRLCCFDIIHLCGMGWLRLADSWEF